MEAENILAKWQKVWSNTPSLYYEIWTTDNKETLKNILNVLIQVSNVLPLE